MSIGVTKPQSVMAWAGISAKGRTPLIFVPVGVKIHSAMYQKLILDPVVKDQINVEQRAISIPARRRTGSHIEYFKVGYAKIFRISFPRRNGLHQVRFESHGLLNLVHLGDKSL